MLPTEVRLSDLNGYQVEWDSIKSITLGVIRENLETIKRTLLKSGTEIKPTKKAAKAKKESKKTREKISRKS